MADNPVTPPPHPAWDKLTGTTEPSNGPLKLVDAPITNVEVPGPPYECPECKAAGQPKSFDSRQGLGSHRSGTHKVEGIHKRRNQTSYSRRSTRTRQAHADSEYTACPVCSHRLLVENLGRHMNRYHAEPIIELSVDDIFNSTVALLYPEQIPTKALEPLLKWREATARLLEALSGS
jgi:DNA-directed RNA polymerase subunit RPC12/RpoP